MGKQYQILLIVISLLVFNLLLSAFQLMPIDRPYFYYEYLAIPFLFCFIPKNWIRSLVLGLQLFADAIISLAHLYFFDTVNYILKFPSLFITHFPWYFWLLLIVGIIIFIWGLHLFVNINRVQQIGQSTSDKKKYSLFLLISFGVLYFFDSIFGFSMLNFKPNGNNKINIGKSIIKEYYKDMALYIKSYEPVSQFNDFKNINGVNKSISYHYLFEDSSEHQVLIILESWGLIKDSGLRNQQIQSILQLEQKGYHVQFDSSYFFGGTSQAEARELINKEGEAYYSILQNDELDIEGLPQHKNKTGYYTMALQSFSGFHSSGQRFRTILGFNDIKDYSNFKTSPKINENNNNHYQAVNDETVFDYGFRSASAHPKTFTYILTINTHLPFVSEKASTYKFPTDEAAKQYKRLQEQFAHLSYLLQKFPIDKLIIVGDHPPPFLIKNVRNLYDDNMVPALIITHKSHQN
jgi:hypothetical protein